MSSILDLSDEVLIYEVLPRLPNNELVALCQVNRRINDLCWTDTLWQIKTLSSFPTYARTKPPDVTWRSYYRLLYTGRLLPIYYQGDRVGYVPFHHDIINTVISMLLPFIINLQGSVNIVFIDKCRRPIIAVKYPDRTIDIKSPNYSDIMKVLIFVNDQFNNPIVTEARISRGRKTNTPRIKTLSLESKDEDIIYEELASPLGHPPIYGMTYYYSPRESYATKTTLVKEFPCEEHRLKIIDNRNVNPRIRSGGRICFVYQRNELIDMLYALGVPPPIDMTLSPEQKINEMRLRGYNDTDERLIYIYEWSRLTREEICEALYRALEQIGHII